MRYCCKSKHQTFVIFMGLEILSCRSMQCEGLHNFKNTRSSELVLALFSTKNGILKALFSTKNGILKA